MPFQNPSVRRPSWALPLTTTLSIAALCGAAACTQEVDEPEAAARAPVTATSSTNGGVALPPGPGIAPLAISSIGAVALPPGPCAPVVAPTTGSR